MLESSPVRIAVLARRILGNYAVQTVLFLIALRSSESKSNEEGAAYCKRLVMVLASLFR